MPKIISIANQKGGVGKTTIATQLAYHICGKLHKPTLLVDLDPQGNASAVLHHQNPNYSDEETSAAELFKGPLEAVVTTPIIDYEDEETGEKTLLDLIHTAENDRSLANIEQLYLGTRNTETGEELFTLTKTFKKNLNKISSRYDFIVLDCPPSLNSLLPSALLISDAVVSPITLPSFTRASIEGISKTIFDLQSYNPNLKYLGIIVNNFDNSKMEADTLLEMKDLYGSKVFEHKINHRAPIGRASKLGNPIWIEKNGIYAANEFEAVFSELFERWEAKPE